MWSRSLDQEHRSRRSSSSSNSRTASSSSSSRVLKESPTGLGCRGRGIKEHSTMRWVSASATPRGWISATIPTACTYGHTYREFRRRVRGGSRGGPTEMIDTRPSRRPANLTTLNTDRVGVSGGVQEEGGVR